MNKIVSLLLMGTAISLVGCATQTPPVSLTPGADKITFGLQTPPRHACVYIDSLVAQYGSGKVWGPRMPAGLMRKQATILLRNQAYAKNANFVFVKREDAEIQGAYKYQMATSVTIYGDAFVCKNFKFLNN